MQQRRPSSMPGMGLGSRGDRDNHRRESTVSQSTDAELQTAFSSVAEYQVVFQQLKQECGIWCAAANDHGEVSRDQGQSS